MTPLKIDLSETPKWHKYRKIPFPLLLQEAIKELWAANGKHEFVFCRKDGKLPGANYIRRHLSHWLKDAGISLEGRKIVPHSARHSIASALEARGVPQRYIGDMPGHSNLKTTRGYLHTVSGAINDMGTKIDEIQKGQRPSRKGKRRGSIDGIRKGQKKNQKRGRREK
jgi:integrase